MPHNNTQTLDALKRFDYFRLWSLEELNARKAVYKILIGIGFFTVALFGMLVSFLLLSFENMGFGCMASLAVSCLIIVFVHFIFRKDISAYKNLIKSQEKQMTELVRYFYQPEHLLGLFEYLRSLKTFQNEENSALLQSAIEQTFDCSKSFTVGQKNAQNSMLSLLDFIPKPAQSQTWLDNQPNTPSSTPYREPTFLFK